MPPIGPSVASREHLLHKPKPSFLKPNKGNGCTKKQHRGPRVLEKATNTAAGKHHLDILRRCVVFLLHTNDLTGFQQGCYNDPTHIVVLNCNGK